MRSLTLTALFLVLFCLGLQDAVDLQLGSSINGQLAYTENVKLSAFPFITREKNVFYNDNSSRIIRGIWVIDRDQSEAKVKLTAGGVGFSFANVQIKSQRGDGLDYQVQIFV